MHQAPVRVQRRIDKRNARREAERREIEERWRADDMVTRKHKAEKVEVEREGEAEQTRRYELVKDGTDGKWSARRCKRGGEAVRGS